MKEDHVKFSVKKKGGAVVDGIGFGLAPKFNLIKSGPFDIAYQIDENEWQGNVRLQLMVKDVC